MMIADGASLCSANPFAVSPRRIVCRGGEAVDVNVSSLPIESPLRHMLAGHHSGLANGASTLDVDAAVLSLIIRWIASNCDGREAVRNLAVPKLAEAIEWADYLCEPELRKMLQSRILRGRIKQATDLRLTGNSKFDAVATLTAFDQSGRDLTVLKGLSPADLAATIDAARLCNLHTFRLGSEFPRALVIARPGVHMDLRALATEHAPRTARASKHGSGGRTRRRGGK